MSNNPTEITYETIVGSGRKSCIGHRTAYLLHIPGHYFVAYEALPILYLWVDLNLNNVTIYYADGSVASWTNRLFDAYITQFGISISADGDYIFCSDMGEWLILHLLSNRRKNMENSKQGYCKKYICKQ